ncbi:hypothetical protein TorRG33x02_273950 [Trema orientale]|uniref:Uncharacterized protein n=1 Tax=Trema orientale TaxID=63057 RepID=A0A2P5CSM3_TREOI|nr:hypothetical protein TorRG33x02_273950 [Trema orientale]
MFFHSRLGMFVSYSRLSQFNYIYNTSLHIIIYINKNPCQYNYKIDIYTYTQKYIYIHTYE